MGIRINLARGISLESTFEYECYAMRKTQEQIMAGLELTGAFLLYLREHVPANLWNEARSAALLVVGEDE